jgi:hypothetical protein
MQAGVYVTLLLFLFNFNQNQSALTDFVKSPKYEISKIASFRAGR